MGHVTVLADHPRHLGRGPQLPVLRGPGRPLRDVERIPLAWRAEQLPGLLESNFRLGTEVLLKTAGDPVTVTQPDGAVRSFPGTGDRLALETPVPGLYSVVTGASTNFFAVNPLAADESDLTTCATGQWGAWQHDTEQRQEQSPMAWIFALVALGVLTAHLYLLAAGKGGN